MARTKNLPVPETGTEAPEFHLPSAQGGQLRLSMRIVRGPVVVVFFRGAWSEEDVGYFRALAEKEDEINHAAATIVGVGAVEADEAREFSRASGIKSYVLYDYPRITTRQWGLLEKDKQHGEYARPAVFIVDTDRKVAHAWVGERPSPEEILARVSEITGLPKAAEEKEDEKPQKAEKDAEKPKKLTAEERERIKAERRAAREAGKSVKSGQQDGGDSARKAPKGSSDGPEPEAAKQTDGSSGDGPEGPTTRAKQGE